jgi:hypothetical protein
MRPQTRPFTIEVKSRKRPAQRASAATPQAGITWSNFSPPGDSELGRHDDLASSITLGRDEASRVFGGFGGGAQVTELEHEPELAVSAVEAPSPTPRVLPDLVAAAREQERIETATLEAQKRKRASSGPVRKPQRNRVQARKVEVVVAKLPSTNDERHPTPATVGHAAAALRLSRRALRARSKLPPGQRWKERRLPRVCWDR